MTTIQHLIGPNFKNELTAAQLNGLPISWTDSQVEYDETVLTTGQAISLTELIAAHEPSAPRSKTSEEARTEGEAYVHDFFSDMQLMRLQQLLLAATTSPTQLEKIQAVLAWLDQIEAAWLSSPATFKASNYGEPPHTYADILSA